MARYLGAEPGLIVDNKLKGRVKEGHDRRPLLDVTWLLVGAGMVGKRVTAQLHCRSAVH